MGKPFYILSVDGGGFRGVFAAHILKRMEENMGVSWLDQFDMFAGTSTGSIIAGGLACGLNASDICAFYEEHGSRIFKRRLCAWLDPWKMLASHYSHKTLSELLHDKIDGITLGQVSRPLIIPAVDIGNGKVHVFKSKYSDGFIRDPEFKVADAILASCSAPTYFDPHLVSHYRLADGGIWANNPSLVAAIDAHYRLGVAFEDIKILSIGSGATKYYYPEAIKSRAKNCIRQCFGWGLLTRWGRGKLVDLILSLQSDSAHNMLCLMLGQNPASPTSVLRINFESDTYLPMDNASMLRDWLVKADYIYTHNYERLASFLGLGDDTSQPSPDS